ncbi:hypothetical protein H2200_012527 [Cladophialophora chaetospira]|uniref:Uncharacterized protein n=1 Tax=Cladophialophora chaetospira TaxID=386627 RepID=A0AA38WX81_9EURO|nr:hypothetical protein H2200_012527 [Cladophialophora chaetospira]
MSGQYSVEDLLKLRASPLICKPPNLPAIEEWMGTQEPTGRRALPRASKDEAPIQNETFQKRPTLLDSHRRTTTDPDRIVLGPPRRSFASSNARTGGKAQDAADEKDRTTFGDKAKNGDELEPRQHERRNTQTNGRYGTRQEYEDQDTEGRRDYDRKPKWAGRDRNDQDQDNDQSLEEFSRGTRRDTQSRAKLSQSWFRKDTGDLEDDKAPDWRRDRGRDRDWDRNAKVEAEPEWMDSAEPEEPFQARTQEDFQKWKERMKAGGAAPLEKIETAVASPPPEERSSAKRVVSAEPDDSMDKFFAKFENKTTEQKAATLKAHGKSKFASLFSPASEQNKQVEFSISTPTTTDRPSSAQAAGPSTDADQAGFARILEMLQTRSNNPTPQTQEVVKPRTPLYARGTEQKSGPEAKSHPDKLATFLASGNPPNQQQQLEQSPPAIQQQRSTDTRSPLEQHTHTRQQSSINKDEVLLNLLRQASLAPKPQPPPPTGSGMFGISPEAGHRPLTSRATMISPIQAEQNAYRAAARGSMFDESPVSIYQNEPAQREQGARRPTNGSQPTYSDEPLLALLRGQPPQQRPTQPPQQVPQGYPPGLQRPPGLDQMARQNPNWSAQQPQPPQQPPRQPSLPPGLANLPRGMSGAPYGQPQQIPAPQTQQQRPQQPQRKYTAESPMAPNLPPGMYPPPGFMNAGPPPGFPGGMANHPAARFGGDPGPQQRAYMEMYGEVGGRGLGLRGGAGNGGMPPYR